jgi:hypothetical protein
MSNEKLYSLEDPLYDMTSYWGRYASILNSSNVRYSLLGEVQVRAHEAVIAAQKAKEAEAFKSTGKPHVLLSAA